uniref:Protein kinase domain-containing protein n=1 Tax=Periophthalmus magnuspinnatus TaxID=409849 RepID=A0A3B4B6I1_9GOBI
MSGQHTHTDGTDDYTVQQENELEALASIFGDDFQDLRNKDPWKVKRPPEVHLCLRPNGLNHKQECYVTVDLLVKCPATYPDLPPELELKNAKGLSNEILQNLQREITNLATARCGEVMIYELADHIQGFLSEHNKPPSRSFHEEMLKNQRRQQEKKALEEQQKMDLQRDTVGEDNHRAQELLNFSSTTFGELAVHKGKNLGDERLGRSVHYGFEVNSGDFVVIYEWSLRWSKKMGKFFTSQEKGKIENCKKQIHGAENELNSLLRLEHPNLVHYMALSSTEKEDCIIINLLVEHVSGTSLNQHLKTQMPVSLDKLCLYTSQLLFALDYLHCNSVVHKQLGASSVIVDSEGNVRLTDYSLSKRFADICKEDIFEQSHVRFSEATAMPTKTGKKGDVWNLGLMLLSLSQGKEVTEYPVTVPTSLPADFQDFLQKCLCLNDGERWTPQQLLEHSFLKPPSPKLSPHCQDASPEDLVDFASTVIPQSHILNAPFSSGVQRQFSRYFNEFEELQLLGKGAFGAVIKVIKNNFYVSILFQFLTVSCLFRFKTNWTAATML